MTVKNFPNMNLNPKLYPFYIYLTSQPNFIIQIFSKAKATPSADKKDPKLDSQQVTSWFKIIQLTPLSITVRKSLETPARHAVVMWSKTAPPFQCYVLGVSGIWPTVPYVPVLPRGSALLHILLLLQVPITLTCARTHWSVSDASHTPCLLPSIVLSWHL